MNYSIFKEQLDLARDKFALDPQVYVNFANGDEPIESISYRLSNDERFIQICVGAKNLYWNEKYDEKCENLEDCLEGLLDRDDRIEELEIQLNDQKDQIEELQIQLDERDTEIAELQSQIEQFEDDIRGKIDK
jgi:uncharacterized coiled-coil protein SlyX